MSIASTLLLWTGAGVCVFALLGDAVMQRIKRWRGTARKRCPKCWYDLSHAVKARCSECGYEIACDRQFYRGRRRWGLVALAMLMLLGSYAVHVTPGVRERGMVAAVPTTGLILAMPWIEQTDAFRDHVRPPGAPQSTLGDRLAEELIDHRTDPASLWRVHEWLLVERCLRGDSARRPISREWSDFYGAALHELRDRSTVGPYWLDRAEALVEVEVKTRPRWPVGTPVYAGLGIRRWNEDTAHQATLVPKSAGLVEVEAFEYSRSTRVNYSNQWFDWCELLGTPIDGAGPLIFDARIERRDEERFWSFDEPDEPMRPAREYEVRVPIQFVATIDEVLEPIEGAEVDEALANALSRRFKVHRRNGMIELDLWSNYSITGAAIAPLEDVTIALWVEVLRDGEVVAKGECWSRGRRWSWWPFGRLYMEWLGGDEEPDAHDSWTLRLRSNPEIALRDFDSDRYWKGQIELPLQLDVWAER